MNILVTGGAGSLGGLLVYKLLRNHDIVRVLDINEAELASFDHPDIRKLYGSICDPRRVDMAMRGIEVVIHTAALKNITIANYNPEEAIRTNVEGTQNIVNAALTHGVRYNIFISSDKAVYPTMLYGVTKLMGEHIWGWGQQIQSTDQKFCIIRSGNFFESRGNVFEIWERQHSMGVPLTLTHKDMTRYFIHTQKAAELVVHVLDMMRSGTLRGGEIVVPKMAQYGIKDLMEERYPGYPYEVTGLRRGEKLHEELTSEDEREIFSDDIVRVHRPGADS
jgi:UDP-N-acetylglucosamine 4,6-dehydratase